jgi:hypothetical protein
MDGCIACVAAGELFMCFDAERDDFGRLEERDLLRGPRPGVIIEFRSEIAVAGSEFDEIDVGDVV